MPNTLFLPQIEHSVGRYLDSPIVCLRRPAGPVSGSLEAVSSRSGATFRFTPDGDPYVTGPVLVVEKPTASRTLPDYVLLNPAGAPLAKSAGGRRWLRPRPVEMSSDEGVSEAECGSVRESWRGAFAFKGEQRDGDKLLESGLRPPQIGALHAVLAHWTVSHDPATIVMPTGTGKTETMVGLLVAERLGRVLVIVPTDNLRDQIAGKFLSLGVLKAAGVVAAAARLPFVGILRRKPKSVAEVDAFFRRCNVVVTTAHIAGACSDDVARHIASTCTHLFVDEAHHVRAPTWERVRASFARKPVLQFTATPYRGDGKLVDGKVIYNYPLRKAQDDGYFRPIRFLPVEEYDEDRSDERIAEAAVKQLDADLLAGHDHIVMARCSNIKWAERLQSLYLRVAARHHPVLAHSELSANAKREALERLRSRTSRIVVCVDMFGEGFDLPELKIAALHDVHKSLAVTLQFTGRFTRSQANVGEATIVANVASAEVEESLRALYGEDPDWNHLLRELTEHAAGEHTLRSDFLLGFTMVPDRIPLQNILPKMSTVVFKTKCPRWNPELVTTVIENVYDKPAYHPAEQVLVVVTVDHQPVEWGDIRGIYNTTYDLYLLHWHREKELLFIHSSEKSTVHEDIAAAICGKDVQLIKGEQVYRVLGGVNRRVLTSLGLGHSLSRAVRFTMHVGADIREGLSQAHAQNKRKTNLFARGFTSGNKVSVGCSVKGRVWSFRVAQDIPEWVSWCHETGDKLLDDRINVDNIIAGAMVAKPVADRPAKVPVTIEWSDDLLDRSEEAVVLEYAGGEAPFYEVGIKLLSHEDHGPLRFSVSAGLWAEPINYEVRFGPERVDYVVSGPSEPTIKIGKRKRPLSEYLRLEPPVVRFHDGTFLIYTELFEGAVVSRTPFDAARIAVWDWSGVDLAKESQREEKRPDSIQRRVIERVLAEGGSERFDVVFDDDESGEAADVVAIRLEPDRLFVRLYHCKYSHQPLPGSRVKDLYEVCGQAQKSVYWKGQPAELVEHLLLREGKRLRRGGVSRFERGDQRTLKGIQRRLRMLPAAFEVFIVQPGLSKAGVEPAQLDLLAGTELYLQETYNVAFGVIASP